jgi:hypothetical protein
MSEPEGFLFVPEEHDFSPAVAAAFFRASKQANARRVELHDFESLRVEGDDWRFRMSWLPSAAAVAIVRRYLARPPNVKVAEMLLRSLRVVAVVFDDFEDFLNIDNFGDILSEFTASFWGWSPMSAPTATGGGPRLSPARSKAPKHIRPRATMKWFGGHIAIRRAASTGSGPCLANSRTSASTVTGGKTLSFVWPALAGRNGTSCCGDTERTPTTRTAPS